jgi:uncharacterized protein YecA (UPF0149 family)
MITEGLMPEESLKDVLRSQIDTVSNGEYVSPLKDLVNANVINTALEPDEKAKAPKLSGKDRNKPCPCGSGKKIKKCDCDQYRR